VANLTIDFNINVKTDQFQDVLARLTKLEEQVGAEADALTLLQQHIDEAKQRDQAVTALITSLKGQLSDLTTQVGSDPALVTQIQGMMGQIDALLQEAAPTPPTVTPGPSADTVTVKAAH
jgi:hypothetical protein